ncbi:MAG: hypothetical protein IRY94_16465, partial [Rhodospirillaceae bacterium]|nr:hypothetical protein [Rhodospirillaceae bacterium]
MPTRILDAVLGRGESAITVPALDGAFRANRRLDDAPGRFPIDRPGAIAVVSGELLVASGEEIRRLEADGSWTLVHRAKAAVTCLGGIAGGIAVGLEDGTVKIVGGPVGRRRVGPPPRGPCPG